MIVFFLEITLLLVLLLLVGLIVHRVFLTKKSPILICFFLIFPISQLFMLYSFSFDGWSIFWVIGILLGMFANLLFLFYATLQEKRISSEQELQKMQHLMEYEELHFKDIEQKWEDYEKARIYYSKELENIASLTNCEAGSEAHDSISALAKKINGINGTVYCGIPVINALLTQKDIDCAAVGIELSVKLHLPTTLNVKPIHLCSIFGNLIDNAIAACEKIKDSKMSHIHLSSMMDGDYLFIKITNPANKPERVPAKRRGYGQDIVTELAHIYDGSFQRGYQDGMYTAVVSLTALGKH